LNLPGSWSKHAGNLVLGAGDSGRQPGLHQTLQNCVAGIADPGYNYAIGCIIIKQLLLINYQYLPELLHEGSGLALGTVSGPSKPFIGKQRGCYRYKN
jgi:hypothetical protein